MANDIDSYLKELQQALAGADRALVQDAVFDAEEYLQAELVAGTEFKQALESYGTPQEVAAAYLGAAQTEDPTAAIRSLVTAGPQPPDSEGGAAAPQPAGYPSSEPMPSPGGSALPDAPPSPPAPAGYPAPGYPAPGAPPIQQFAPPNYPPPAGVTAGLAAGAEAPPGVWQQVFGVFVDARVYKALVYMILSLVTGTIYFTIVVTGLSLAGGLIILIIGIPLLLLVLGIVRAMALFEGRLVELLLGTRMPRRPRAEPPDAGILQRVSFWVKDGRTWASMAYMILMLPLGVVYLTIAVTGLALGLGLITTPFWAWLGSVSDFTFVYEGVTYDWWLPLWAAPIAVVVGVIVLVVWLHLVRWIGRGHAAFAKALLVRLSR